MKKSQKGFTLVELVVVIAIIGVLAAILVPSMLNYVKKSRLKTANSNAKTAYNAASEYVADQETKGVGPKISISKIASVGTINCTKPGDYDGSGQEGAKAIANALASNGSESGCVRVFSWNINGEKDSIVVHWGKTESDEMVGQYPDAITWEDWSDNDDAWTSAPAPLSEGAASDKYYYPGHGIFGSPDSAGELTTASAAG